MVNYQSSASNFEKFKHGNNVPLIANIHSRFHKILFIGIFVFVASCIWIFLIDFTILSFKYRRAHAGNVKTKQTPTSHAKDTHTHTTTHTASLIHLLVKITREAYTNQRWR